MADKLTQLQDCLDDLLTQMHASLAYIQTRHPYGEIQGQPSQAPTSNPAAAIEAEPATTSAAAQPALTNGEAAPAVKKEDPPTPPPEPADRFNTAMHELARDLVLKEQQIEIIINELPGIGTSEQDQERRMRELEVELRQVEQERRKAEGDREQMVEMLGQVIVGTKRVP